MIEISVKEARSKLSRLLDRVEKGEEIASTWPAVINGYVMLPGIMGYK